MRITKLVIEKYLLAHEKTNKQTEQMKISTSN